MTKKLLMTCALVLSGACLFSGCGFIQDSGVAESEVPAVAEYIAKQMLKYDKSYVPDLEDTLEVKAASSPAIVVNKDTSSGTSSKSVSNETNDKASQSVASETGNVSSSGVDNTASKASVTTGTPPDADTSLPTAAKLSDIYGKRGFSVVYGGASVHSAYPEGDSYFSLSAEDGRRLYVITFTITNKSGKKAKFAQNNNVTYDLTFDDSTFFKPSMTLLENDMQFIEKNIGSGLSTEGVLIFSVPKNVDRGGAKLYLSGNKQNYVLTVVR